LKKLFRLFVSEGFNHQLYNNVTRYYCQVPLNDRYYG
jgi:hypothetical protein